MARADDSFADKAEDALILIKSALEQANSLERKEQVPGLVQALLVEMWPLTVIEADEERRANERDFQKLCAEIWQLSTCNTAIKKALEEVYSAEIHVFASNGKLIFYQDTQTEAWAALRMFSVSDMIEIGDLTDDQLESSQEAMRWIENGLLDPDGTEH